MIFMAAFPIAGRQIIPQLRFHEAGQIPVYATSHIFTGSVNPQADMDMDGVMFLDLPWILFPHAESSSIKSLINANFQADASVYQRLYALGGGCIFILSRIFPGWRLRTTPVSMGKRGSSVCPKTDGLTENYPGVKLSTANRNCLTMAADNSRAEFGRMAEDMALRYLQKHDLTLLTRNFRSRFGEIDLIMQEKNTIIFIEVRAEKK